MKANNTGPGSLDGRWAYAPWLLLGGLLSIQAVLYSLSTSDPGFAVEPDYYAKAVNWDAQRAQTRRNEELEYTAVLQVFPARRHEESTMSLTVNDASSAPVTKRRVTLTAFANARAAAQQSLSLSETAPGVYSSRFRLDREGIWEFRVSVERGAEVFTYKTQQELAFAQ